MRTRPPTLARNGQACLLLFAAIALAVPAAGRPHRAAVPPRVDYARLVERVIIADSEGWLFKRYVKGSVRDVTVKPGERPGNTLVNATYGYATGDRTWITIVLHRGKVQCVAYGDEGWGCRALASNPLVDTYAAVARTPEEIERDDEAEYYARVKECNFDPRAC